MGVSDSALDREDKYTCIDLSGLLETLYKRAVSPVFTPAYKVSVS
jgi:hypothetical protein